MLRSIFQSQANAAKSKAIGNVQKAAKGLYFKYALIFSLVIALYSAISFVNPDNILFFFIGLQAYSMFLGVIHVWLMGKKFGWRNIHSFFEKVEMTILILLVSMIVTGIVVHFSELKHLVYIVPTGILFFAFPMLTISVFDFAMAIPPEEYKKWFYPEKVEIPDMDKVDFTNSYILNFEIYKRADDRLPKILQFKAPLNNIAFGEMFYMYVFEFNEARRESPIEYADNNQKRYAWLFHIKPKHWWNSRKMIDPSLTVRENKIKEKEIIVPSRVD